MIIFKHGSTPPRFGGGGRTILPFARDAIAEPVQPPAPDDIDTRTQQRRERAERLAREADVIDMVVSGDRILEEMEADLERDPFSFCRDAERAFDALAKERFGGPAGLIRHRGPFERLAAARADFRAVADAMQTELEETHAASAVFRPARSVIAAAQRNPEGKQPLFDRLLDLVDQTPLSNTRKNEVAAAVTARALSLGLENHLGPRFAGHKEPARRLLDDIARIDRDAAQLNVGAASTGAPADRQGPSLPGTTARTGVQTAQAAVDVPLVNIPGTRSDSERSQELLRRVLPILGAGALVPAIAAAFLVATTGPAGEETQELRETLEDGRDVRFRFNRDERTGELMVTDPSGEAVQLTLLQSAANGLVFTDGAVLGGTGQERTLTRDELGRVIDAVVAEFAEAGVRIEIGGGDGDDAGQGGDGRDLGRDDNKPPQVIDDADREDLNPDPEDDDDDRPIEDERPDLGKHGSRRNPDGTLKGAQEQFEQIEKAQSRNRAGIESTKKSDQNVQNELNDLKKR